MGTIKDTQHGAGQGRAGIVLSTLALMVTATGVVAGFTHGDIRLAAAFLAALVFFVAAGFLYYELVPHRYVARMRRKHEARRQATEKARRESDWRAGARLTLSNWVLELYPPGPITTSTVRARQQLQIDDAIVRVENETGVFQAIPERASWGHVYAVFPDALKSARGAACPLEGDHQVIWTASNFDGERRMSLHLDAWGREVGSSGRRRRRAAAPSP